MRRKRRTGALPALPTISGLVAQSAERPVVCGRVEGATPFESTNVFDGSQFQGIAVSVSTKPSPQCLPERPGQTARSVAATCSAWDRVTAGAIPAALTNFSIRIKLRHPPVVRYPAAVESLTIRCKQHCKARGHNRRYTSHDHQLH